MSTFVKNEFARFSITSKFFISRQILEITAEAIVSVFVSVMTVHNS